MGMAYDYTFKDVLFFRERQQIDVQNETGDFVGSIVRTSEEAKRQHVRKGTFYALIGLDGDSRCSISVEKRGLASLKGYSYFMNDHTTEQTYQLADVPVAIYLYFHIKGKIKGMTFEAYQDWDESIVLKLNKEKFAAISFNEHTFQVDIQIIKEVDSFFVSPAFLSLIYCIFRMYDIEREIIDQALDLL